MARDDLSYMGVDSIETLPLSPDQVVVAATLSQRVCAPLQWQTYLNGLAWAGVQTWFSYRAPDLSLESQASVLRSAALMNFVSAIGPIQVNGFSFSIIASSIFAEAILLPRAMIEIPALSSHVYLWVEVREEDSEIRIAGMLRHDHIQSLLPSLVRTDQWQYMIPVDAFSKDTGSFLRLIYCGTPEMVPLSCYLQTDQVIRQPLEPFVQQLMMLQSVTETPWRILTWEDAKLLLNTPPLTHWLKTDWPSMAIAQHRLQQCLTRLWTPVINVAQWLEERVDEVSPLWTPAPQVLTSGLRGAESTGTQLFDFLGIELSSTARARVRDFSVGDQTLQLYAIAQSEPMQYGLPHWSLLLLLTAMEALPFTTQMQLTDGADLQLFQRVNKENPERYLFIQVMGLWTERFWVTLELPNLPPLELEPFVWQPT